MLVKGVPVIDLLIMVLVWIYHIWSNTTVHVIPMLTIISLTFFSMCEHFLRVLSPQCDFLYIGKTAIYIKTDPRCHLAHPLIQIYKHAMMTSSNGNIFRVTDHLCGEFTGPRWIPPQRPVKRSFDVFFDLRLNKRLSKQSWGWWFETLSNPLWRHSNAICHGSSMTSLSVYTVQMQMQMAILFDGSTMGAFIYDRADPRDKWRFTCLLVIC